MITVYRAREIVTGEVPLKEESLMEIERLIINKAVRLESNCIYNYNYLDDTNNIIAVLTQQGFKVDVYPELAQIHIEW